MRTFDWLERLMVYTLILGDPEFQEEDTRDSYGEFSGLLFKGGGGYIPIFYPICVQYPLV